MNRRLCVAAALGAIVVAVAQAWGEPPAEAPARPEERWKKWDRPSYRRSSPYPEIMSETALAAGELPKVVAGHPRLLVRAQPWKGGLSVEQLRQRARQEPWATMLKAREYRSAAYGPRCALYYLTSGDESVIPGLVDVVLAAKPQHNCGGGLVAVCMIYDWIAASPSLTAEKKAQMRDHIARTAFECAKAQESAFVEDMWHHRGAAGWASDVLVAGLTLAGEHPEADTLLAWGAGYFRNNYFAGWARTGGTHMGGGHRYYRSGAAGLPMAIACWQSAAEDDVCRLIRERYNDFLQGNMYAMMYQVYPDKTRVESTGFDYAPHHLMEGNYLVTSWCCKNPDGYAFLRWLGRDPKKEGLALLLYDETLDQARSTLPLTGPSARMWGGSGPGWFGYVQMRSNGWAKDSTVIEFKCGDRFWSHGFNTNQNSFYIFRKGRLAPHTGYYNDWDASGRYKYFAKHMRNYYEQTVASNSMLVFDPREFEQGPPGLMETQDKEGFYPIHGGQRTHTGGSNCFSFAEFLARMNDPTDPFECGDMVAFEHADDFSHVYACGDATGNYNNPRFTVARGERKNRPKVELFTRSLAWLDNRYLVVFDRVNATDASFRKAWLLHSISQPQVSGRMVASPAPGHIEDFDGDTVTITWSEGFLKPPDPSDPGRLICRTFLPAERTIRRIGGDGYEFYAGDRNWPPRFRPTATQPATDSMDVGAWRVEVSPARPARFDQFLHLLYPTDATVDRLPPAEMVAARDDKAVGLRVGGQDGAVRWQVMFGRSGQIDGPIAFDVPAGRTELLVVDLRHGGRYELTGAVGTRRELAASKNGALRFASDTAGPVTIRPLD